MNIIRITTNYDCQEISGTLCSELSGGSFLSLVDKVVKVGKLIHEGIKLLDAFIDDIYPSFIEGFKEGWEAAG